MGAGREWGTDPPAKIIVDIGVTCRLAHSFMLMTRDELVAANMDSGNHESFFELMTCFASTGGRLKELVGMVEGAHARVLASMTLAYEKLKADHHAA